MSCNSIVDRNSNGEEQITSFTQFVVNEENTNLNKRTIEMEKAKPPLSKGKRLFLKKTGIVVELSISS